MSSSLAAPPLQSALTETQTDLATGQKVALITRGWNTWLQSLTTRLQTAASLLKAVTLSAQSASIATTPVALGTISAGLYRVSWHARITTPGTVSSSLTVTIGYTETAISCVQSGAALTGNTTATVQSGVVLVKSDQATAISYATTYASVGATAMVYKLDVLVELVN